MPKNLQHSLNQKPPTDTGKIRILRLPEVISRVGLKRSSIYRRIWGGYFPKPVSLGGRAVGWFEHEVDAWLIERVQTGPRIDMII